MIAFSIALALAVIDRVGTSVGPWAQDYSPVTVSGAIFLPNL